MNIAFIHEWIASYAGSEKVLTAMAELYPDAPIYLTIHNERYTRGTPLEHRLIHTSFLQRLPWARTKHHLYLPLMPYAVEQHNLSAHDVVVSSSHAVAKGVLTRSDQLHISYVHTPMRYAWDMYLGYEGQGGRSRGPAGWAARWILHYLRMWDRLSADRVDVMVANSQYVARRIWKTYRRRAQVIYPPVDIDRFRPDRKREDFYLVVSRLVAYKRVDLIIEAFRRLDKPLVVIGTGPEEHKLRRLAGPTVRFLANTDDQTVTDHMERCRALVVAAEEDFGITSVEAQAAGAPVVSYGQGGSRETIVDGKTGVLFARQDVDDLCLAVQHLQTLSSVMLAEQMRLQVERFSKTRFKREIGSLIDRAWSRFLATGRV
jgi:glycosyltransferase involved in cell wall biosynthesis